MHLFNDSASRNHPSGLELSAGRSAKQDRHVLIAVRVAVAQLAEAHASGAIEHRARPVLDLIEGLQHIGVLTDQPLIDSRIVGECICSSRMMGDAGVVTHVYTQERMAN